MADTALVAKSHATKSTKPDSSTLPEAGPTALSSLGGLPNDRGLSDQAAKLVLQSWRENTRKQYNLYIKRWQLYCRERQIDSISAPIATGVNFLAALFKTGIGYSALNTARSALSTYIVLPDGNVFGTHPLVRRLMKGVLENRPSLPRYGATDIAVVLNHLRKPQFEGFNLSNGDVTSLVIRPKTPDAACP